MSDNIDKEENLSDIVFSDAEKSDKTKKFMFGGIIAGVVLIIVFVLATSFSSEPKDEDMTSSRDIDFLEDDDSFFMDSPIGMMNESDDLIDDELKEDTAFSKESLLNSSEDFQENSYVSSIQPATLSPMEHTTKIEDRRVSTSLMSEENEIPTVQTIRTEEVKSKPTNFVKRELYIQTGTFFKYAPNKKFLKSISDLGFKYYIDTYTKNSQNITRVLVGPFEKIIDGNKALILVKEKIVKDAYILKTRLH